MKPNILLAFADDCRIEHAAFADDWPCDPKDDPKRLVQVRWGEVHDSINTVMSPYSWNRVLRKRLCSR